MSDTPRTDAVIAAADACPETRVVFLIKNLANLAKQLEREAGTIRADSLCEALNCYSPDDSASDWAEKIRALITPNQ